MGSFKRLYKEQTLLRRVRVQKDPDAFAALYDLYIEKIYRFILFKIGSKEDAEDLTSNVFLRTWDYLTGEQGREVRSFSGLVYTTARRIVIDTYRERAKQPMSSLEDVNLQAISDVEGELHVAEQHRALLRTIKTLKQEYQEVILLRFVDELSMKEIADILGKKATNVRVLLHRAVKKLQEFHSEDT